MNLLSLEQSDWQPNLSIKDQKIANELAECREERLFNQRQYQKEKIKKESADHEKNEYSSTIIDEIRKWQMKVKNLRKRKTVQINLLCLEQRDWQTSINVRSRKMLIAQPLLMKSDNIIPATVHLLLL